jgi:hypothetical protein
MVEATRILKIIELALIHCEGTLCRLVVDYWGGSFKATVMLRRPMLRISRCPRLIPDVTPRQDCS